MTFQILDGDCIDMMREMEAESVHCVATSPPYFNLRDYGAAGQIGMETTPAEYVAKMVMVAREVRRVLRRDGTFWLNLGDSYSGDSKWGGSTGGKHVKGLHGNTSVGRRKTKTGLPDKNLIGIPWRVAFALQDDGWFLRQDIVWSKPNAMPESVTDRCTRSHEYLFMFTRSARYFYDADAIKEPVSDASMARVRQKNFDAHHDEPRPDRNKRSVWTVATVASAEQHFAMFPPLLITPVILAGCPEQCCSNCGAPFHRIMSRNAPSREVADSEIDRYGNGKAGVHRKIGSAYQKWLDENPKQQTGWLPTCKCDAVPAGGTVLDPFSGAGTTAMVAQGLGRNAIGIELNPEYAAASRERILTKNGMLAGVDW
jgi:DNA modification methylase